MSGDHKLGRFCIVARVVELQRKEAVRSLDKVMTFTPLIAGLIMRDANIKGHKLYPKTECRRSLWPHEEEDDRVLCLQLSFLEHHVTMQIDMIPVRPHERKR